MNKAKIDYRSVFLALRADIKAHGGFGEAAKNLNVTEDTLTKQTDPNYPEISPPTLGNFIELINRTEAKRTVAALADLAGQITVDRNDDHESTESEIQAFLSLVKNASDLLGKGSVFAMDNRFDSHEREQLLMMLLSLQKVTGQLYRKLNR